MPIQFDGRAEVQEPVEHCLPILAAATQKPLSEIEGYWKELKEDREFLAAINKAIEPVTEFSGKQFRDPAELRPYRCMLYILTRAVRPEVFVETGVHNGLGSAFSLLALMRNGSGVLHSVDLPPIDQAMLDQGNRTMPEGKPSGWVIPAYLRRSHRLYLAPAQVQLPKLLAELGQIDLFLHDSDHSYQHMMFEMGVAWDYIRPGGWLVCDNIEANDAWRDFDRGMGGGGYVISSFDTPTRVWKHGLLRKPG
ncbi:MAG TPA: class I SAM-dependent methyltransferase, partial [Gemmatimonadales bacterium]|nr:class I SAM-dependent methyltransferase [Gemmatimonadales bacterium]